MRKIPTTMAVMSLLFPMGANALGVGDIKLHSALNQLLNAEIPLVTSGSESISEVRVNLASPDDALRQRSVDALTDELRRAERLGLPLLISHPSPTSQEPLHGPMADPKSSTSL